MRWPTNVMKKKIYKLHAFTFIYRAHWNQQIHAKLMISFTSFIILHTIFGISQGRRWSPHTLFCRIKGASGVALLLAPQFYEATYTPVTYFCPKTSQHDLYFTSASKVYKFAKLFKNCPNPEKFQFIPTISVSWLHKLGAGCEFAHSSLYKIT